MDVIEIFTDGACSGNPGPGGYAAVLKSGERSKEIGGGFAHTTNSRMELMAVICGLEALNRSCKVTICSDSVYVVGSWQKGWAQMWRDNQWRGIGNGQPGAGRPIKNRDLWGRLFSLSEQHDVSFQKVRAHSGHPENDRADQLAVEWRKRPDLPEDEGYVA